jgi:hemerythrin-like domain-containing protein
MLPIGPLMIEHRLMERMLTLLKKEADRIERGKNIRAEFLDTAIDFNQTYVDRCHHGKEEDILLKELGKKDLSDEHRRIIREILDEHGQARKTIAELKDQKANVLQGDRESLSRIVRTIRFLVELYTGHIEKEDNHFFLPCMAYFSREEKDSMLAREQEFDRNLMHQIYREKVTSEEARDE